MGVGNRFNAEYRREPRRSASGSREEPATKRRGSELAIKI